jgi:hypothetical protein
MPTTLAAVPARLGDLELSKAVVGVADTIVDALPDRQSAERVVEALTATVAATARRRQHRGVAGFVRSHPLLVAGFAAVVLAALIAALVKRSRQLTVEPTAGSALAA